MRIGVDATAPKEFVDKLRELGAKPKPIGPRPQLQAAAAALGVESAAAFDFYVQMKAKELGHRSRDDSRAGGRGGGGGGAGRRRWRSTRRRRAAPARRGGGGGGGGGRGDPGNPTGMAALTRWTGGRFPRAFDFIQAQRRRYMLITQMAELLKDLDMYVPGGAGRVRRRAACADRTSVRGGAVQVRVAAGGSRRRSRGGASGHDGRRRSSYNPQPICAVLAGNLYNDDKILSVAHQYQSATEWHLKHPNSNPLGRHLRQG